MKYGPDSILYLKAKRVATSQSIGRLIASPMPDLSTENGDHRVQSDGWKELLDLFDLVNYRFK
jgi:hypothetical protein